MNADTRGQNNITVQNGDILFREKKYDEAAKCYIELAQSIEIPDGDLCCKIARCLFAIQQLPDAASWATRVVDSSFSFAHWTTASKIVSKCGADSLPRLRRKIKLALVGTWTTNSLVPLIKLAAAKIGVWCEIYEAPFNQYFNEIINPKSDLFAFGPDILILAPDYHALGLPSFTYNPDRLIESEVERWSDVWQTVRDSLPLTIIQQNFALPHSDSLGHFGSTLGNSRNYVSNEINRLIALRARNEDVGIIDANMLSARFGKELWFDQRNWYLAKIAVSPAALPLLAQHTAAVIASKLGLSRRCLVLDLDNTLWGGVIGDDGLSGITIGSGPDGEAFIDFQHAIKELSARGIVLAVCSKNELDTAKIPFLNHPDMVLKLEDIAVFMANWLPKSDNLMTIAQKLNLGLDSLTFLDDNPYERTQVRRSLPEIDVITLPSDPTGYRKALELYPYFEPSSFTSEDQLRSQQYQARAKAEEIKQSSSTLEEYQASLNMVAIIGKINDANLARTVQLINKTNQFNLTTRRRDTTEVQALVGREDTVHFWVRLKDQFADHGLIAVIIAFKEDDTLEIDTLLMSCRVIGRGVEEFIFNELVKVAKEKNCKKLLGTFIPTDRNKLVADLYPRLGFDHVKSTDIGISTWQYNLSDAEYKTVCIGAEYDQ